MIQSLKRNALLIASFALLLSCENYEKNKENEDSEPSKAELKDKEVTEKAKEEMFQKLELVIEKKVPFSDISITYDEMLAQFSPSFRDEFEANDGNVFKSYMLAWAQQSETLLKENDFGDVEVEFKSLISDKEQEEINSYTGTFSFKSKGETKDFRITAYEIKNKFYVNYIHPAEAMK